MDASQISLRISSADAVNNLLINLNNNLSHADISDVDKVTNDLITNIINNDLQSGKSDEYYDWGSDALKFGVTCIVPHFIDLFKCFLVHGHITQLFLCCALLPLVKNAKTVNFNLTTVG